MNFDLANNTAVALSYKPTVTTAGANGTGVDIQGKKIKTSDGFKYLLNTIKYRIFN